MISFLLAKLKDFVSKCSNSKRDVEHYLSQSVDRADFERREQKLKYKGYL